jgi:hypothetical protein
VGVDVPGYGFREEASFKQSKTLLDWPDEELEDHLHSLQLAIVNGPLEEPWSVPLAPGSNLRVAVSSGTLHNPIAIRVIFRVEGNLI